MNLRVWLAKKNIRIGKFARDAGISPSYLSQIINGHLRPSDAMARKIEAATGNKVKIELRNPCARCKICGK